MRLFTLDRAVEITSDMFDTYVEHVGLSLMSGEVPSVLFSINRRGTKERDWLAQVRFKNTLAISVFRCDVYLEDIFRLCRQCKLYLITEEVYQVVVLYGMLHPLFQSQYFDFGFDVNADYESMMAGAGVVTYEFIRSHFGFTDSVQNMVLDILRWYMMIFTNHHGKFHNVAELYETAQSKYERIMQGAYPGAYQTARYRKAQMSLVDKDGYLLMERRTDGRTIYDSDRRKED